jgi:Leucine-rich repeat (LRR) protein
LYSNAIDSIVDDTFAGLSKLEYLDLEVNQIRIINKTMFNGIPLLEELSLVII